MVPNSSNYDTWSIYWHPDANISIFSSLLIVIDGAPSLELSEILMYSFELTS
jgi:hypothetical protein